MTVFTPKIPEGMVDLMKTLTKNVLKEKPDNIYEYAAIYCENLLKKRDGSLDKGYGKFRSYEKYCKFMETMELRRKNLNKQNDDTDSGVGSSNTDDETTKTVTKIVSPKPEMKVNGVSVGTRKTKPIPPEPKKSSKNYSINPKLKAQGSIERDRRARTLSNTKVSNTVSPAATSITDNKEPTASEVLLKKNKSKPRKLSSKKPSESLIVIKEETSSDVAEVDENVKQANAANTIQKAFRRFIVKKNRNEQNKSRKEKEEEIMRETIAAIVIQKSYRSFVNRKNDKESNDTPKIIPSAPSFEDVENLLIEDTILHADKGSEILKENEVNGGSKINDDKTDGEEMFQVEIKEQSENVSNDENVLSKFDRVRLDGNETKVILADEDKELEENKYNPIESLADATEYELAETVILDDSEEKKSEKLDIDDNLVLENSTAITSGDSVGK